MKIRHFGYTKDNGDVSNRLAFIVSEPRDNYLVYDVGGLSMDEVDYLEKALQKAEDFRDECLEEFEAVTGQRVNSLWRSFKPGGIDWRD